MRKQSIGTDSNEMKGYAVEKLSTRGAPGGNILAAKSFSLAKGGVNFKWQSGMEKDV